MLLIVLASPAAGRRRFQEYEFVELTCTDGRPAPIDGHLPALGPSSLPVRQLQRCGRHDRGCLSQARHGGASSPACPTLIAQSALKGYRDEAKGIKRPKPTDADAADDEPDRARSVSVVPFGAPARPASPPAASARRPAADDDLGYEEADLEEFLDDDDALEAMREVDSAPARPKPPPPASRPLPSTARSELDRLFDDDDEEEVLREMDKAPAPAAPIVDPLDALLDDEMDFDAIDAMRDVERRPAAAAAPAARAPVVEADLFDDLDDDAMAALEDAPAAVETAAPAPVAVEDAMDEDLLLSDADLAALMEAEQAVTQPAQAA